MPKKKLTKAQVKRTVKTIISSMTRMFNDKIEHSNSDVPMSAKKLLDSIIAMQGVERRIK
jgi:hypothetical protein